VIDPELHGDHPVSTSKRALRQFAVLWLLVLGGLACVELVWRQNWIAASVMAGLAVSIGLLGLVRPPAIRPLFMGLMALTYPIGVFVSKVLLVAVFHGLFTPVALFFRFIGRDALARRRRSNASTYWKPKPAARDVRSYFRLS
jgi:hypothetical protein